MAIEPKTRPTDASVDDFLAAVDNPVRRADALVVRDLLAAVTGEPPVMWGSSIVGFGSYPTRSGDWPLAGFSPRKAQTVVYVMPGFSHSQELLAKLGKHSLGKSCLYLPKLADVDLTVLAEIVVQSVADTRRLFPSG